MRERRADHLVLGFRDGSRQRLLCSFKSDLFFHLLSLPHLPGEVT